MSTWFSPDEMKLVAPAEIAACRSPIPTQVVSNGEFTPIAQTDDQRRVERRLVEMADSYSAKLGMARREFLSTASGMATAFLAFNQVFGAAFDVQESEANEPETAAARANSLKEQLIFDDQVHFVRDDFNDEGLLNMARYAAKHWSPDILNDIGFEIGRYKFDNFIKEIFLDSDTKVALLSGFPVDEPKNLVLSNDQIERTREVVNRVCGTRRMLCHAVFSPGKDGWMDDVDYAIETLKPESWKGYTVGDPNKASEHPWRLDDEKLVYPFYEKILAAGVKTVCIHKGLMPSDYEKSRPGIWKYATVDDVPKAAGDWPDLNFVIYHSAMRPALNPALEAKEFEETGYIRWVSDLAAIPKKFDVNNVFAEIGTVFGSTVITNPRLAAGMLGTIIKGMGVNHLIWGTDSVWWGSPQWQIEALRRLEIPDDLLEKHKFAPLGRADGAVKNKIFWDNGARLYGLPKRVEYRQSIQPDLIDEMKEQFKISNVTRSNAAYGYVMPSRKPPVSATDQCDQAYLA